MTGEEEIVFLDHPTGFSTKYTELGMSTIATFTSDFANYDHTGKYAEHARIEYSGPEGYVFSDPSRSHRFVFVDQAAEDIDPANA